MADIPINPVTRRVEFTGNTGTGPFAFTFNVLAQADVAAYKNNTLLALTSDYTVSLNSNGTGSITLASALIATDELVIIGDLALSRTTDFVTAGDLLASSLNEQFDSNVVMSQQLDERFDRTIRSQPGDINKNLYLPLVSSRASQLLSFDSSGNITTTSLSNVPDIGTVNLTVSGVASFADGSASAPSITNIGDTNTGMYFGAADQINFSIGGSEVISVASTGTTISGLSISSGDILLTDNSATALEIKEGSNNYLTFITTNGSEKLSFGSTANPTFEVNGSFRQPLIAATTSFFSQTYSGATLSATNGAVNIESYSASKAGIVLNGSGDQITFTSPTLGFVGLVQVVGAITTNTSLNIASSTTVTGILDEDNMASNSATKLATQQSIKAYVDAQVGAVDTLAEVLGNGNTTGGTAIQMTTTDELQFRDTALKISSSADGQLDIDADTTIQIVAPTVDINASTEVNISGTLTVGALIDTPDIETSTVSARDGTTSFSIANSTGTTSFDNSLTISRNSGTGVLPTLDIICTDTTAIQNQTLGALDFQTSDTNEAGTLASIRARKTNSTSASTNLAALELYTGRPGDLIKAVTINADQTTSFAAAIDVSGTVTATGTSVFASLDISGDIDVDGTTNLDATNIVGALDVTGTITSDGLTVDGLAKIQGAATGLVINETDTTDLNTYFNANSGDFNLMTTNDAFTSFTTRLNVDHSTGDISFFEDTGSTAKFFWDANAESLGIGTSSPNQLLELRNTSGDFGAEATIRGSTSVGGPKAEIAFKRESSGDDTSIVFRPSDNGTLNATAMTLNSSGKLGIGTTSPSASLEIKDSVAELRLTDSANDSYTRLRYDGAAMLIEVDDASGLADSNFRIQVDGSEAMRIDASGHLLVGKTSSAFGTQGIELQSDGELIATKNGTPIYVNRITTDGDIIELHKDGTEVGSIGVGSGDLIVGNGSVGVRFNDSITTLVPRTTSDGAADGTISLGFNTARFKDLYLSGGVYLGGTGSANKLDDYEEGTWTPSVSAGSISGTSITYTGTYRKVGSIVLIRFKADNTTGDINVSSYVAFGGLPFACNMTATSTVSTEDIDIFDRQGFARMGSTTLTLSNCGSSSGTTSLSVSIVGHTA